MSCGHESWCDRKPYVCSITENFFQNRRTFEQKKMFLMSKIDFHKKFEKSFHEMFLMITASFNTFDEFRRLFKERKKFQKLEGSAKDDFFIRISILKVVKN